MSRCIRQNKNKLNDDWYKQDYTYCYDQHWNHTCVVLDSLKFQISSEGDICVLLKQYWKEKDNIFVHHLGRWCYWKEMRWTLNNDIEFMVGGGQ